MPILLEPLGDPLTPIMPGSQMALAGSKPFSVPMSLKTTLPILNMWPDWFPIVAGEAATLGMIGGDHPAKALGARPFMRAIANHACIATQSGWLVPIGIDTALLMSRDFRESSVRFTVTGVSRDSAGAALGACTVYLFDIQKRFMGETVSDGSGNYSIDVPDNNGPYFVAAWKTLGHAAWRIAPQLDGGIAMAGNDVFLFSDSPVGNDVWLQGDPSPGGPADITANLTTASATASALITGPANLTATLTTDAATLAALISSPHTIIVTLTTDPATVSATIAAPGNITATLTAGPATLSSNIASSPNTLTATLNTEAATVTALITTVQTILADLTTEDALLDALIEAGEVEEGSDIAAVLTTDDATLSASIEVGGVPVTPTAPPAGSRGLKYFRRKLPRAPHELEEIARRKRRQPIIAPISTRRFDEFEEAVETVSEIDRLTLEVINQLMQKSVVIKPKPVVITRQAPDDDDEELMAMLEELL